jgi:hypothetical protein
VAAEVAHVETVTVDQAIARGSRIVNWPVRAALIAPALLYFLGRRPLESVLGEHTFGLIVFAFFAACFVAAWLWWSVQVPKWRLWAYERVADIPELKRKAILVGLTWPDGSIFARTEIKSSQHAALERELEERARQDAAT